MAHREHNKPKSSGPFALIIFGALLLILAPTIYQDEPVFATIAFVSGFIIGGLGFYLRYIRKKRAN